MAAVSRSSATAICSSAASLAPRPSVASVRAAARARALGESVVTAIVQNQVIAMNGLRDPRGRRVLTGGASQLGAAHGNHAGCEHLAVQRAHAYCVARAERALHALAPNRQKPRAARKQRRARAGSD